MGSVLGSFEKICAISAKALSVSAIEVGFK
jgi:hypothetical protein